MACWPYGGYFVIEKCHERPELVRPVTAISPHVCSLLLQAGIRNWMTLDPGYAEEGPGLLVRGPWAVWVSKNDIWIHPPGRRSSRGRPPVRKAHSPSRIKSIHCNRVDKNSASRRIFGKTTGRHHHELSLFVTGHRGERGRMGESYWAMDKHPVTCPYKTTLLCKDYTTGLPVRRAGY